jgi:ribonuclease E
MPKQIIIAEQHQIAAVFWEDQIQELVVATGNQQAADIYLGLVENVIPGTDSSLRQYWRCGTQWLYPCHRPAFLKTEKNCRCYHGITRPQQKVLVQVMKEPTGNTRTAN